MNRENKEIPQPTCPTKDVLTPHLRSKTRMHVFDFLLNEAAELEEILFAFGFRFVLWFHIFQRRVKHATEETENKQM